MDTELNPRFRPFALLVGLLFALCTLLAGLTILQVYVCDVGLTHQAPLGPLLRQEFKDWYALGFISLGVVWLPAAIRCNQDTQDAGPPFTLVPR